MWLLLGYAVVVLAGARLMESLARAHFGRARRYAEQRLPLRRGRGPLPLPARRAVGVARDRPARAGGRLPCPGIDLRRLPEKARCTPHDDGRHIYRPLAAWAETDVGRFHQWLSLFMAGSVAALSLVALWSGRVSRGRAFCSWRYSPPCA